MRKSTKLVREMKHFEVDLGSGFVSKFACYSRDRVRKRKVIFSELSRLQIKQWVSHWEYNKQILCLQLPCNHLIQILHCWIKFSSFGVSDTKKERQRQRQRLNWKERSCKTLIKLIISLESIHRINLHIIPYSL